MVNNGVDRNVTQLALKDSIVQSFMIRGLYGYRTVSMSSYSAASILIARNGSGKTTLLGALDAFLRGHFTRLRDIPFQSIECKLNSMDRPLVLNSRDLDDFLDYSSNAELTKLTRQIKFDSWSVVRFIVEDYGDVRGTYPGRIEGDLYSTICRLYDFNIGRVTEELDAIKQNLVSKNHVIEILTGVLKNSLKGIDIVYLPTYRRIELPLVADADERHSRLNAKPSFKLGGSSLFAGGIEFGLTDISERLSSINNDISFRSSYKYREVSANIVTELAEDEDKVNDVGSNDLPTKSELDLFFSRVRNDRYAGPYHHNEIPNLDKVYVNNVALNATGFLRYYLSKLDSIIKSTRDVESSVDEFIKVCNTYLSQDDDSALLENTKFAPTTNYDAKQMILDKSDYSVHVENAISGKVMSIDYLSSGEKQMISLFAKIYLYPNDKIVLIDEPELSLSLDWQRRILVDVLLAPQCKQVIAITHSPFVFDNALDAFAGPLNIHFDVNEI